MDMDESMSSPEFKRAFWIWFDKLSQTERDKFNYYKDDMAHLFFYNKVWRHRKS